MANAENPIQVRVLIQQCLQASLMVKPASENEAPEYVKINRGMVVFICFMKSATADTVNKLVKAVSNVKLCEQDDGRHTGALDLPGDILVIPQATLGGRLKGKSMQYHNNVDKDLGLQFYSDFVQGLKDSAAASPKWNESSCVVHHGTYGNRQVLKMDTNGPYSHIIEL